ncbi:MAG: hypothetical protein HYR85_07915 [Planctomycetes bacterium]|nr:hypothetical protein [Planctomycetota bacterium]MBI3848166.1 hypothetical protein [Planctomycetota bacterium]
MPSKRYTLIAKAVTVGWTGGLRPLAIASCLVVVLSAAATAAEKTLDCRITYETPDGFYVDAGATDGLRPGDVGLVKRESTDLGRVEVVDASSNSATVRLVSQSGLFRPSTLDRVVFVVEVPETSATETGEESAADRVARLAHDDTTFVPLLAPFAPREGKFSQPSNVFHGRLRFREQFQIDSNGKEDFSRSRVGTEGSIDRIDGSPWAFEWSGDLSYRSGSAFSGSSDYPDARADVYRLALFRKFESGDSLELGRFLPVQLPGIGYVDGVVGDLVASENFHVGGVAGVKPRRFDLSPSIDEPTAAIYATGEFGKRGNAYYSGTLGVLGSAFKGKADRLALLADQRADLGSKLSLYSTNEVDFDVGGAETRSGPQLSRMDLYAVSPVTTEFTLRAGVDHYQRPDTAAERDLLDFTDNRFFDRGYWRYWVGSSEKLPLRFGLDEEIAFIDAPDENGSPRWRVTIRRTDTLTTNDSIALTVFNLDGSDSKGLGGQLAGVFPAFDDRLTLRPAIDWRYADTADTDTTLMVSQFSLYVDWWFSRAVSLYAGAMQSVGDAIDSTLVDMGLDFRW